MTQPETLSFATETRQLLKLMIHSLYSNREIFLRELISNASDALDKLRFEGYSNASLMDDGGELRIEVACDPIAHTVTVRDNGLGMSRDEVIANIGTIAHSGTNEFLQALESGQAKDANLIGQFGVGFYSAFIVADRVTLTTRRADLAETEGVRWQSAGEGDYTLEPTSAPRGTEIVLHLRDDAQEFSDDYRLKSIIRTYSDHITFPVCMPAAAAPAEDGAENDTDSDSDADSEQPPAWDTVNQATALWAKPKTEISQEQYDSFYKQLAYDAQPPLALLHSRIEGGHDYTALLFVPAQAPFDLWDRERRHGVKLYVKRVFIMDDAAQLLPAYLRFARGVIDSDDLPLNVSREILQNNKVVDAIRSGCTRRMLSLLEEQARDEADKYARFWGLFGRVLKEGVVEDHANRDRIAALLRFASTRESEQTVSLADYVARMKDGQKAIYYLTADSQAAAAASPQLEVFRARGVEVLLLGDRIDEWLASSLPNFDGKPLQSAAQADLKLDDLGPADAEQPAVAEADWKPTLSVLQTALESKVESVRLSDRLTESPACLVASKDGISGNLERLLKSAGQDVPDSKRVLEINPHHPLLARLKAQADAEHVADWALLLYEQALLAEGGQLEEPAQFVQRLNRLLLEQ
ncbi:MAG: molecular chaperone HtpG [Immundisolibacter sp.]|uniref:molecular chaperone HtpG n=1 Tax=Immundisolibacter sp. TaxID=1934948 RepID=UPI003EDF2035